MQVVVKKSALISALGSIIGENRTSESGSIDDIMRDAAMGEEPIEATEQMSTQLSVDMPNVSDPDFVPATVEQLSRSAYVISNAVPEQEIEWFYRKLHEMLDEALDRDSTVSEEEVEEIEVEINESVVNKVVSMLIEQNDEIWSDDEIDKITVAREMVQEYLKSISFGYSDLEISSGEILDIPLWSPLMKRALDDTIGPKSIDQKIAEIVSDLTQEETERVFDDIREEWMTLSRKPVENADPGQISVNQVLAKELDTLLPKHHYKEIIEIYTERLTDQSSSPDWLQDRFNSGHGDLWRNGIRDMIEIVKGRIRNPLKRERTDFSVRSGRYKEDIVSDDTGSQGGMSEEERLKTLESLAPLFGFKNASGLRQWRMKFPEAIFKVVLGSEGGIDAYKGYSDKVYDYLSALLDNLSEIIAVLVEDLEDEVDENPEDSDTAAVLEILQQADIDLVELREKRSQDEDEMLDSDMLINSLGGKILRQVFSISFYRPQFIDYAREMMKHMIKSLTDLGVNPKTAKSFAKMFNGEVELQEFNSGGRQIEKLKSGGITQDIYRQALAFAQEFNKEFFGGQRLKALRASYSKFMRDPEKLTKAIFQAVPEVSSWGEIEKNNPQLRTPGSDDLAESNFRNLISGILK